MRKKLRRSDMVAFFKRLSPTVIGIEAYGASHHCARRRAAGGAGMRDLFAEDGGGWLQNVPLLERLVAEKLSAEAEAVAAEGWKWVDVANSPMATPTGCAA